jgi:broad specificity phosphatase PhoE
MEVYFIRHGETDGNVARRHQHIDTEINDEGKRQVTTAAYHVSDLHPTHIITSTQLRAVQSAKIIADYCDGVVPETHPAFEELKAPRWLVGHRFVGLTTFLYVWKWFWGKYIDGGENYREFLSRIRAARTHLESLPDNARVVVVSHAVFTNIFLEHICSDEPMTFRRAVLRFWHILRIRNAGMIHLRYAKPTTPNTCGWHFMEAVEVVDKL